LCQLQRKEKKTQKKNQTGEKNTNNQSNEMSQKPRNNHMKTNFNEVPNPTKGPGGKKKKENREEF